MKKVVVIIAAIFMIAVNAGASGGKIAYFDIQSVFNKTVLGNKYQGIARGYYESRQKILDADAEEIQKLKDDYIKQKQAKRNDPTQTEMEETLSRKISEFEKIRTEFSDEVSRKNDELSSEFNKHISEVLKVIAKREKLSLILNRTINVAKVEVQSVAYADEDLDITDKIVVEMDKKETVVK